MRSVLQLQLARYRPHQCNRTQHRSEALRQQLDGVFVHKLSQLEFRLLSLLKLAVRAKLADRVFRYEYDVAMFVTRLLPQDMVTR